VNATGTITVTTFTCGTNTISDIDGNTYNTVSIGTQCWTKENLRVRKYNDGNSIPFILSVPTWSGVTYGAHTIYAFDSTSNLVNYGYLYNWYAAIGVATSGSTIYKNICPTGWHVPSDSEWTTLTTYLSGNNVAGSKMRTTGTSLWTSPNTGADNSSGFSGLPGGSRGSTGSFGYINSNSFFWSTTDIYGSNAYVLSLAHNDNGVGRGFGSSTYPYGASVRCLKN
jgi:uncharacterized protein (TIGR02145 family)